MAVLLMCVLLGTCAAVVDPLPDTLAADYVPAAEPQAGVVIGSVTSLADSPHWQDWSLHYYRNRASPQIAGYPKSASDSWYGRPIIPFAYRNLPPDYKGCAEGGLESECGRLFALELPAGDYAIDRVTPAVDSGGPIGTADGSDVLLSDYRFSVAAGEIVYIGNLNSRVCVGGVAGRNEPIAVSGEVRDLSDRDLALLRVKYPFLGGREVIRRIIAGRPWRQRRGERPFWLRRDAWSPEYGWERCHGWARETGWSEEP